MCPETEETPAATVIVPAMNVEDLIGKALDGLAQQDCEEPFEVIVVDDGSDDDTVAVARRSDVTPRVLRQHRAGPGPARNAGARIARAPVLAFLDADCVPEPEWLREGLAALRGADLVQGRVVPDPAEPLGPFDRTLWVTRQSPLFESANLFVRRELFEQLGGFDDWLVIRCGKPLAEDVWFGWRARRSGARGVYTALATVHHAVFERGPRGYIGERARTHYFPAIVAKVPELRREFLYGRFFLSPHSAKADAALAGLAIAAATRSPWALGMGAPYAWWLLRRAGPHRRNAPLVATAEVLADALTLAALVTGSVRWRTAVL